MHVHRRYITDQYSLSNEYGARLRWRPLVKRFVGVWVLYRGTIMPETLEYASSPAPPKRNMSLSVVSFVCSAFCVPGASVVAHTCLGRLGSIPPPLWVGFVVYFGAPATAFVLGLVALLHQIRSASALARNLEILAVVIAVGWFFYPYAYAVFHC